MLWFLLTLAMVAAAAAVAWPFLKRTSVADGASADIYKAQLTELDREESAGLTSSEDARMARTEIQRRLIATTGASSLIETPDMTLTDRTTFIAVAASIAIGSAVLYMTLGAPGAMPVTHPQITAQNLSGMNASAMNAPAASGSGAMSVAPVDEMIGSLETRLKAEPNDVEGWRMLGWSKFRTDDFAGAAAAYGEAAKLAPGDSETQSSYGESLSRAAGGLVTEDATRALQAALKTNPADPRARFLLGLKKEQTGKPQEALNDWLALLESANDADPWYDEVRGRVVELSQSSGIDVSQRLPPARNTAAAPPLPMASSTPVGPTAAQVSEAAAMSPEARQAMIDGMVGRLEQRLKQNPNDLDGWMKLIRSYRVLGRTDLAAKAATDGQAEFAGDKAAATQLKAAMLEPISN